MARKLTPLAIAYDFDGTLAPGNMQERDFIPAIGMTEKDFWKEVRDLEKKHQADNILMYMGLMLEKARAHRVTVRREDFENYGRDLDFFAGVEDWFERINLYGRESGVRIEHFVISSGIREMILGSRIGSKFKAVFASSFQYDHHGVAQWPALALNYTTKTQYLFRINKGSLNVYDHSVINEYVAKADRPVPFENMIFIGDGLTDIPCFRLVKDQGGHSIAVYKPRAKGAKERSEKLIRDGRVSFAVAADYREDSALDRVVKSIIDKTETDAHLGRLRKMQEPQKPGAQPKAAPKPVQQATDEAAIEAEVTS
jgi:phosphoserine phosphatase